MTADEIEVPATEPDPPYVDIEPVPEPVEDPAAETPAGVEPA